MPRTLVERLEEAGGLSEPKVEMPYKKGEYIKSGETARPLKPPWKEKGKADEPAHGKYEHNSPAKPL